MTWQDALANLSAKGYRKTENEKYETFVSKESKSINLGTYDSENEAKIKVLEYREKQFKTAVESNGDNPDEGVLVEDHYIAYPSGNIYNLYGHKMEGTIGRDGYRHMIINKKNRDVHRVIADAFIPNDNDFEQINHINGVKDDNRVENLEWCTRSDNLKHAFANGLESPMHGESNPIHKLTENDVRYIRQVYKKNDREFGFAALARKFDVDRTTVSDAAQNISWRYIDD